MPGVRDAGVTALLRSYQHEIIEDAIPISVLCDPRGRYLPISIIGDGNCLFRALSRGLFGDKDSHELMRLLTPWRSQTTDIIKWLLRTNGFVCGQCSTGWQYPLILPSRENWRVCNRRVDTQCEWPSGTTENSRCTDRRVVHDEWDRQTPRQVLVPAIALCCAASC